MNKVKTAALLAVTVLLVQLLAPALAQAATWPILYTDTAFSGANAPLFLTGDGTGSRRYVVERAGRILVSDANSSATSVFLDIRPKVSVVSERGLLGLAFEPDYAVTGRFYVYYVDGGGLTHLSRFQRDPGNADLALPASEVSVLTWQRPFGNHNGGWIGFGPDGMLYVASGDGGSSGDPQGNGQKLSTLLGKLLRLDVVGAATYAIPPDNPFVGTAGARGEIWAYGLRNPWRCSFDSAGRLFIGDVGQDAWEEIDVAEAGAAGRNYGWRRYEGNHPFPIRSAATSRSGLTFPVVEHAHPGAESITGGYVYEGATYPNMRDTFFYGDFEVGKVWGLRQSGSVWSSKLLLDTSLLIPSFGVDDANRLYFTSFGNGTVYELRDATRYSTRIAGSDRYRTAVAIAKAAWPGWAGVTHVLIASGEDRSASDPLAASGLSWAYHGAPILLVSSTSTPASVRTALSQIRAANGPIALHIVGGTASVPTARVAELRAAAGSGSTVERVLATGDRFDLAAAIARRMKALRPAEFPTRAFIANGADPATFADALSLAPISAATGTPVLLVTRTTVPNATRSALSALGLSERYIAGGTASVSEGVSVALGLGTGSPNRLAGSTRYDTSVAIAEKALAAGWSTADTIAIAGSVPDAVSSGASVGHLGGVVITSSRTGLPHGPEGFVGAQASAIARVWVLGSTASLNDDVRRDVARQRD